MITPRAPVWRSKRRNFAVAALLAAAAAAAVLGAAGDCDACIARVAAAQGARADAAAALQYARSLARDHPDEPCVWHCSGVAAYFAGSADEALRAFQRAVALEPSAAHLTNLGVVANSVGELELATQALQRSVELDRRQPQAALMLPTVLNEGGDVEGAMRVAVAILAEDEQSPFMSSRQRGLVAIVLCHALTSAGRLDEAEQVLLSEASKGQALMHIRRATALLPPVPSDSSDIMRRRGRMQRIIADLIALLRSGELELPADASPLDVAGDMAYYLTYHGVNDRPIRESIVNLYTLAFPGISRNLVRTRTPAMMHGSGTAVAGNRRPPQLKRKIRVGFLSAFLFHHSVGKMTSRLISALPRSLFEVVVLFLPASHDWVYESLIEQADEAIHLTTGQDSSLLDRARQTVADANLDVLVFPEIGMDLWTYLLAFSRLAPVQMTTHGNSVTAGLMDTIDYWVSLHSAELPEAQDHYSEQLVRLDAHHSGFLHPLAKGAPRARPRPYGTSAGGNIADVDVLDATVEWLGGVDAVSLLRNVSSARRKASCPVPVVVLVPQTLYKLHPDFDITLLQVVEKDPCALLVLLRGRSHYWDIALLERLEGVASTAPQSDGRLLERIIMLRQREHAGFLNLLAESDVVLDSWPFGGCTSTYEALSVGTPVVTYPSDFLRGRFTLALLQRVGQPGLVAPTLQALPELALSVGRKASQDAAAVWNSGGEPQATGRTRIQRATSTALESQAALHDWVRLLLRSVALAESQ